MSSLVTLMQATVFIRQRIHQMYLKISLALLVRLSIELMTVDSQTNKLLTSSLNLLYFFNLHVSLCVFTFLYDNKWILISYIIGSADFLGLNLYTARLVTPATGSGGVTGMEKDIMIDSSIGTDWER